MTRDDVIRMAEEAGFPKWALIAAEEIERFAALVAAEECSALRARLEIDPEHGRPDGIDCRDATIALQDAQIAELTAERDLLLSAARKAVLALAHAASKNAMYQGDYKALAVAIVKVAK